MLAFFLPVIANASPSWHLYSQTTTYTPSNVIYCGDSELFGSTWIEIETITYFPDHYIYTHYEYPKHFVEIDEDVKHVTDRSCLTGPLRTKKIDSWYIYY